MTVETDVSKEVVAIEEKCGSETNSSQDLSKSDYNGNGVGHSEQVSDPDNSYVFVSGTDGLGDDHVDSKERDVVAVAATCLIVEREAVVEVQNGKLDVLSGDVSESVKEVQIGNVEVNDDTSVVSVCISPEQEKSPEDGTVTGALEEQDGKIEILDVSDLDSVADSKGRLESTAPADIETVVNHNEKIENVVESEIIPDEVPNGGFDSSVVTEMEVVTDQNRNLENVEDPSEIIESSTGAGIRESDDHQNENLQDEAKSVAKQAQDEIVTLESLEGSESEVVADRNGSLENVTENEIKQVDDSNERIDISTSAEIREGDHQNGNLQDEAKSDIEQAQDAIGTLESLDGSESEVVAVPDGNLQNVDENEINQVEDSKERLKSLGEAETETVSDQTEKLERVAKTEFREVEDPNERLESLGEAEIEMVSEQHERIECGAETGIKEVEDPNGMPESSAGAETEKVSDRKNEVAAEIENVADQKNEGEFETEKVADHKNEGAAETEKVTAQTNEGVVESEKVTDQTNEVAAETELQKLVDQIEPDSSHASMDNQESQVQDRQLFTKPEKDRELNNASLRFNESDNENGESGYENDSHSTMPSGICKESESVVEDPIESEVQEVSSKGQNEIKLAKELVETVDDEIPPETSMDTDIEAHPVDSNEETLEEQANVALVSDAMENQKYETASCIQGGPQQVDEVETVVGGDDKQVEPVCEVLEETFEKGIDVSHVEDISQNDEPEKPSDVNSVSPKLNQSETAIEASVLTQSLTASYAHEPHSEIDVSGAETASFSPVDSPKLQIVESGPSNHENHIRGMVTTHDASSGSNSVLGMIVSAEAEQTFVNGDVHVESEISNVKPEIVSNQPDSVDVKLESGSNIVLETAGVEGTGDQVDSAKATTDENLSLQENKNVENSQGDSISVASKEDSSTDAIIEKETSIAAVTKPFNYLMRVPRFNDESLKERIRQAKLQVEEKTKLRDAIQFQIQQIRANGQIHGVDYEYAKGEIRNARKLVRAKRVEIDSLHSVINKAKNAISIDDIDTRIYSMEHMMQHETLPLKEEKQFIREIKQLKSLRDELSSNMGSEDETKQALEQREEAEERLKILRKELEKLKGEVQKAESAAMEAERKYEDENKKVKELQAQFRAANDVRQEAYARWLSLRKELSEKNKQFFKYKDDTAAANNYAFSRDRESLYRLCTDQVEQLMELWNTNEDFRKDYVSFNVRSTVRRFGTFDGRALGPDEEPPILPSYVDERVHRVVSTPTNVDSVSKSVVELKSEATVEKGTVNDKSTTKITENENQKVKSKKAAEPVLANGLATAASWQSPDEVMNEPVKSREEVELDRKAEEMRKKEDEAKLKEKRRLEGLAKANEARERKKRQAEKMQMRAELKARKEAEEKEKEREKRLRKKEKKKAIATDSNDGNNNSDSAPSSESTIEIGREIDAKDMASVVAKKPQKIAKQNKKSSSIPPHIRNRNKRKWQNYAYVTVAGISSEYSVVRKAKLKERKEKTYTILFTFLIHTIHHIIIFQKLKKT